MSAGVLNLKIEKGAKFTKTLIWKDKDSDPISLTEYGARMHIRQRISDTTFIEELTTDNAGIVLEAGGNTGQIELYIGATSTDEYTSEYAVYDLELYSTTDVDNVIRLLGGQITIVEGVTR